MKKRILSIALCLCMVLFLLPATALATGTAAEKVWVNGVELNSTTPYLANNATAAQSTQPAGGYAYFSSGTLTLSSYQNSASITDQSTLGVYIENGNGTYGEGDGFSCDLWAAIYADGDLNLVLSGTNMVNTKNGNYNSIDSTLSIFAREAACVYVTGALTVSGSGSAALNTGSSFYPGTGETRATNPCNYGIYAGSLTVESGILTLEPATTSTYNIEGVDYTTTTAKYVTNTDGNSAFAYGIYSDSSIAINGGSVTAKSVSGAGANTYGIYAADTLSVAAEAAVTAGNYKNSMISLNKSWGIYSDGNMTLSGTVTAEAKAALNSITTGIESAAGLTINGSAVVSATVQGSAYDSAITAYGVKGDSVTISGSANVTASAYASSFSYGVFSEKIEGGDISGGTVTLADAAVISAKAYGGAIDPVAVYAGTTLSVSEVATYTNKRADSTATQILATDQTKDVVINCDPSVRIIFDACNGSAIENIVVTELTDLPAPTLTGYTFAGWYPAPNGENAEGEAFTDENKLTYEKATALLEGATYYAKWTAGADGKTVRTTPLALSNYIDSIDKSYTQGWAWDLNTKTLTLSGANIVTTGQYALTLDVDSVKVVLESGSINTLSAAGGSFSNSAGLYSAPSVTISGAGTLNATSGNSAGIIAPLTVEGATVTATGRDGIIGSLTLTSGAVTANGSEYGLNCGGATISGGTLNATGAIAGIHSSGAITIASGASVTATATGDASGSVGLRANSTLAVNGTLTVKGGTGACSYGADIFGVLSGSGSITATGGTATGDSTGLRLQGSSTFSGTLTATGGAGSESYGISGTGSVALPTTITASCNATANRHFPVWVAGTLTGLDGKTFPGSIASKDGMIVYDNDTVLAQKGYFNPVEETPFSALTIQAGKTLTIAPTANLYVASAAKIAIETAHETTGQLVNNGWIVFTTDTTETGEQIAALGITGVGYILAGDTVYSNDGEVFEHVVVGNLDLTAGTAASAADVYTYENNQLTLAEGAVVLGGVKLPAGKETTVVLKNGASVLGDLSIVGEGEGKLNITVDSGDSASIGGINVQQKVTPPATPKDFLLTIGGGGTLASNGISLGFADYGANDPYDMSVILGKNTTLIINNSLNKLGAGISINMSANTGGLTVRGTLAVHTPNAPISLFLPSITIECGAGLFVDGQVVAQLSSSTGRALTMESGSTFIASGTKASIVIVVHTGQSIEGLVSLSADYLPAGVSFRQFSSSLSMPGDMLYTLARQNDVLVDESNQTYFLPNGGEASVEIRNRSFGGTSTYTLTFDVNGGSAISAVSKSSGTTVDLTAYQPTKTGYTFDGWYSDAELTTAVTSVMLIKNTTLYAKWTAKTVKPFVDVPEDAYYNGAVIWAVENGITEGTTATTFSPDGICTRAQAVTFLWRASGSPAPKTTAMPFHDVPVGSYYYDAVLWAVEQGIITGTSETTFSPDMNCSRAQIVTMLWRMEGSKTATIANPFTDVSGDAYYADAVLWAVDEEITVGTSATTFSPDDNHTRAQIVTFLYRDMK